MEQITYEWIRSNRRTIAIQIQPDGRVIVRTPYSVSRRQVEQFVKEKSGWICRQKDALKHRKEEKNVITDEMRVQGIQEARKCIPERVAYFAGQMGVTYGKITIREQKTRWGSCSSQGNLNFNWKLVLMTPEVLDYVVVHELAHRREMNHSPAFWLQVEAVLPDYRERRSKLKEEGRRWS